MHVTGTDFQALVHTSEHFFSCGYSQGRLAGAQHCHRNKCCIDPPLNSSACLEIMQQYFDLSSPIKIHIPPDLKTDWILNVECKQKTTLKSYSGIWLAFWIQQRKQDDVIALKARSQKTGRARTHSCTLRKCLMKCLTMRALKKITGMKQTSINPPSTRPSLMPCPLVLHWHNCLFPHPFLQQVKISVLQLTLESYFCCLGASSWAEPTSWTNSGEAGTALCPLCSWGELEHVFAFHSVQAYHQSIPRQTGCCITWNWALMLGGFFFLWRWRRDFVMWSWSVRLVRCLRDFTSSMCCGKDRLHSL